MDRIVTQINVMTHKILHIQSRDLETRPNPRRDDVIIIVSVSSFISVNKTRQEFENTIFDFSLSAAQFIDF